jgi:hypothetical protein
MRRPAGDSARPTAGAIAFVLPCLAPRASSATRRSSELDRLRAPTDDRIQNQIEAARIALLP